MNNLLIAVMNDLTHEASAAMFQATITCFDTKHTWLFHTPPGNRCLGMLFYKKPRDCTARVKRKLILLSLCVSLLLLWERGRHTYSSLAYFGLHIRIKHFKYFRIQAVQAQAALSTQHPAGTEEATLGGQHTQVTSITQQSTCHGHPCDTTGTETPTCPSKDTATHTG